jgi:hypothetical protein
MNNNKYYFTNFIIHLFYGIGFFIGFAYSWDYKITGVLDELGGTLMLGCLFPIPIITSFVFVRICIKRWPKELQDNKAGRETLTCPVTGLAGWIIGFALATFMSSLSTGSL